jgi:hypothetical protein
MEEILVAETVAFRPQKCSATRSSQNLLINQTSLALIPDREIPFCHTDLELGSHRPFNKLQHINVALYLRAQDVREH